MDYLWRVTIICVLIAECFGDNQAVMPRSATLQITTPQGVNWPWKTTTHTTTHSTLHTNHTTTAPTTTHTNHTTAPPTTAHTNHTTAPLTTAHTNHTTAPLTTAHTNHTTAPHTSAHTNQTTAPSNHTSTPHTNHTTPHHTSVPLTNHTTPSPPPPSPTEYFINGTSGVCLRIKAVFMLMFNISKLVNYTIPSPPITNVSGNCRADTSELMLAFPGGSLGLTFRQEKDDSKFYLGNVNVTARGSGGFSINASTSLKQMVTPLGRSFACEEVNFEIIPTVKVVLTHVKAQAFQLERGNYGKEMNCMDTPSRSKTVPIVVGVVLLVLIIAVVVAYLIARKVRHGSAGYQPL